MMISGSTHASLVRCNKRFMQMTKNFGSSVQFSTVNPHSFEALHWDNCSKEDTYSLLMLSLVVVLVLVLCLAMNAGAFRTFGNSPIRRRFNTVTAPTHSKQFKQFLASPKRFGEVLDEVEAKFGRSAFKHDSIMNDAISTLHITKEHTEKLKDFQRLMRGEFSHRPGDMPTAVVDPRAKAITLAVKAVVYVALYFVVEAAVKNILLWTNTDKRIKRANLVQQTKENLKAQAVQDLLLKLEMTTKLKDKQLFLKELSDLDPDGSIQKMLVESAEQEQQWQ